MKARWAWLLAVPIIGAGIAIFRPTQAADHLGGPRSKMDPAADINDVYAFMSPDPATQNHAVLAMTVFPKADATSRFSDKVVYYFRVRQFTLGGTLDPTVLDVTCTPAAGKMTCATAAGGLTK